MNNAQKAKKPDKADITDKTNTLTLNTSNKNNKRFTFDFVGKRKIFFIIIGVIFAAGMILIFVRGFNLGIDFAGGTVMEFRLNKNVDSADLDKVEKTVEEITGEKPSSVVRSGNQGVTVESKQIAPDKRTAITEALQKEYNFNLDGVSSSDANPAAGKSSAQKALTAGLIAVVLMVIYITFRFNFSSGVVSVLCLLIDMFVMLTFCSIFQIPVNTAIIAAFLTVLGYSVNATVIVYDRIRENLKLKKSPAITFSQIVNESVNQTFARSVNTTIAVLIIIICVCIAGVPAIKSFALPLIAGIIAGLFSSVCISGPLLVLIKPKPEADKTETENAGN